MKRVGGRVETWRRGEQDRTACDKPMLEVLNTRNRVPERLMAQVERSGPSFV